MLEQRGTLLAQVLISPVVKLAQAWLYQDPLFPISIFPSICHLLALFSSGLTSFLGDCLPVEAPTVSGLYPTSLETPGKRECLSWNWCHWLELGHRSIPEPVTRTIESDLSCAPTSWGVGVVLASLDQRKLALLEADEEEMDGGRSEQQISTSPALIHLNRKGALCS